MGVDLNTYRCRVGQFVPHHGAGGMCIGLNFSLLTRIVGTVSFIRILLVMAGIEQNPGPQDKYVFRYQYLLIEIGAKVLREIFEVQVGRDFVNYLATNTFASRTLTNLMTGKNRKITLDQEKLLPPMEKNPTSSAYDITLLSLLLRNICGLCPAGDQVWMNPLPTDHSVEADITRLRKCRNGMMHIDTLRISEKELNAKWQELEQILNRLNITAGLANLSKLINDTKHMDIDVELKERYIETIKAWVTMDCSLDKVHEDISMLKQHAARQQADDRQVREDISELDTRVGAVEAAQQHAARQHSDDLKVREDISELDTRVGAVEAAQQHATRQHSDDLKVREDISGLKQHAARQQADDLKVREDVSELDTRVGAVEAAQQHAARQHSDDLKVREVMKQNHSELETRVGAVEVMQQHVKRQCADDLKDIQNKLIDIYKRRCKTLPVSPVFKNKDENLLNIYKYPTMYSVKRNKTEGDENKEITCYEGIFCKNGQECEEIYLTGDAGVGKTAFCTCMSLLWCYAKSGVQIDDGYASFQKDFEYMFKFEYLFYVSLRDTCHIHVVDMIIEQLFGNNKNKYQSIIENILTDKPTLIVMDGLDEWMPSQLASNKTHERPDRIYSNNCVYITTSRPHKLESVRLSSKDVDHYIEIIGICGDSSKSYVENVINYLNKENSKDRTVSSFFRDVKQSNLNALLSIPILASHLVVLWFEGTITNMPRALIYTNILEMLFKRAEKRGVNIPSPTESKFQHIPASISGMKFLNKHLSLLYNVCHLSFRALFKSDENAPNLVFTVEQLEDEPYCFSVTEIDFLCHIGIVSKNEVFGCYSEEKLKLSFLHKSYLEFFSALYISSSDTSDLFDDRWKSINYVLQSKNLILLLVGLSADGGKQLFDTLYQLMSDELSLCRTNLIFHPDEHERHFYMRQIQSLQNLVIECSSHPNMVLRLEDFQFGVRWFGEFYNDNIVIQYLSLNAPYVKSIHSFTGQYYEEFNQIKTLQYLHVGDRIQPATVYDDKLSELMIQNRSTLHTVCIDGEFSHTLIPVLPVRSLPHLTSLSLSYITMKHESFHDLLTYLTDTFLMENIKLDNVTCDTHRYYMDYYMNCELTLNLSQHTKLASLYLEGYTIVCNKINTSRLKSIRVFMRHFRYDDSCIDFYRCIKHSKLEHLHINVLSMKTNNETMRTLTDSVKTLSCIRSLQLFHMDFPGDALLELHPDVTTVKIELMYVTMSPQWFHSFIQSCDNKRSVIKVTLGGCIIKSDDGETRMSEEESVNYMSEYLSSIQTVSITRKNDNWLCFETRCQ